MIVSLREISECDLELIMKWRMDPDITRYMNTNPILTLEIQKKWLQSINDNDNVMYWLIEVDDCPAGVICLIDIDWALKNASWGYYIGEKSLRSLKLAISLEMSLYDFVFDILEFEELHNEVFSLNAGVIKLHVACGSCITKEVTGEVEKEGVLYDITHMSITKDEWGAIRLVKKYERINYDIKLIPHHIGYAVADINQSLNKFKKLGYYQSSEIYDDTTRNINIVFMENREGGDRIELIAPKNGDSPVSSVLSKMKNASSPYHICYMVDSLNTAMETMKKRGFVATTKPDSAIAFDNRRVVFMFNKDAGLIELVER